MSEYNYSIKNNRLKNAFVSGAQIGDDSAIFTADGGDASVFLKPIDGGIEDSIWGRLNYSVKKDGDVVLMTYVACSKFLLEPDEVSHYGYMDLMERLDAVKWVDTSDLLLYSFEGRYLYIGFVALGNGSIKISDIRLDRIGDNFQQTFPEIYQERNSFFHRFMSVFSSIYNDLEEEIDRLPRLLDLDTCPGKLLPLYASWFGMDVGDGLMNEEVLRPLVKEAYMLGRMKGTRWCLERISEIILGEKGIVIERNNAADNLSGKQLEEFNKLYGNSVYDITILIKSQMNENLRTQLSYILNQYLPVRSRLHIIQLDNAGVLDSHSYLDVNAKVYVAGTGVLDGNNGMDLSITLV